MPQQIKNRGWMVTFSGTGINLALGILYAWSIFKDAIKVSIESAAPGAFNWDIATLNDPYAICCLVFAFSMILAGKCQDKFGPRITSFLGGILVGIGLIWISTTTSYIIWILGFGVLAGIGIGFGYSAATPPALKWFPPKKTGMIAGLVVAGFGLASVYIAPLSQFLLGTYGIQRAMFFYGIAFLIIVCLLSLMLINPPAGYVPEGSVPSSGSGPAKAAQTNFLPSDMLKTGVFYKVWLLYFIGSGAGLMVIGSVASMAKKSMGIYAFIAVAIMAIGNAGGRITAGILSDKIGRKATLLIMLLFQAILMFVAIPLISSGTSNAILIVIIATFIGFNYGTNLSLFPSFTKDAWGLKNFGINYGILFTAWGIGGFVMGRLSQMLQASSGSYNSSFITAGILLIIAVIVALTLKSEKQH